ncbi:hypothetical protein [Streptococcus halichoeri]|uniref:hypothetical protein n=1 Tax=Streptococcus halichoeri TaxID=254785 RepID=UPI00135A2FFD|nr:hypothetical protein [Streptococcus halichoeri]
MVDKKRSLLIVAGSLVITALLGLFFQLHFWKQVVMVMLTALLYLIIYLLMSKNGQRSLTWPQILQEWKGQMKRRGNLIVFAIILIITAFDWLVTKTPLFDTFFNSNLLVAIATVKLLYVINSTAARKKADQ